MVHPVTNAVGVMGVVADIGPGSRLGGYYSHAVRSNYGLLELYFTCLESGQEH